MHPALLNGYLLSLIFSDFDTKLDGREKRSEVWARKRTLATLALVCRAFYDPAMSSLWAALHDISPLIRCMPKRAWKIQGRTLAHAALINMDHLPMAMPYSIVLKDVRPEDWELVSRHAHRVRSIGMYPGPSPSGMIVTEDVQTAFCSYVCARTHSSGIFVPFFPKLQVLRFGCYPGDTVEDFARLTLKCIPFLAANSLTSLNFGRIVHSGTSFEAEFTVPLPEVYQQLQTNNPYIRHLGLYVAGQDASETVIGAFCAHICTLRRDRLLTVEAWPALTDDALQSLSLATSLSTLRVSLPSMTLPVEPGERLFRALTRFECNQSEIVTLTEVIRSISSPRLATLVLRSVIISRGSQVEQLLEAIGRHTSLEVVDVYLVGPDVFDLGPYIIKFEEAMKPVLRLRKIKQFLLQGLVSFPLRDDDIARLGQAWPELNFLTLLPAGVDTAQAQDTPTLQGLHVLAQNCPYVTALSIPLRVSYPGDQLPAVLAGDSRSELQRLYTEKIRAHDQPPSIQIDQVARFMNSLFPELIAIRGTLLHQWDNSDIRAEIDDLRARAAGVDALPDGQSLMDDEDRSITVDSPCLYRGWERETRYWLGF